MAGVGQPDYIFKNSSLVSGSDRLPGAIYRFPSVKPGVDAIVTINSISSGVSIATFDDNANGGFDEAFQPRISASGKTNGYAEFNILFVKGGTNIPMVMLEVPATSIDVDGNTSGGDSMLEYDEYLIPSTYQLDYDLVNTDLAFTYNPGRLLGKNRRGLEKASIDTLAKEAMFSVIYPTIVSMTVRIGLDNRQNGSTTRQRSVYFKRFFFSNSFLPVSNLLSFSGNRNPNNEVILNWKMNSQHDFINATVERSTDGRAYNAIAQLTVVGLPSATYTDINKSTSGSYYRLRMTDKNGKIAYSTILFMKNTGITGKLEVYPSIVRDNTNISFIAGKTGSSKISVFDLAGRLMIKKDFNTQAGNNIISLTGLSQLSAGQYIVVVAADGRQYTQKFQRTN